VTVCDCVCVCECECVSVCACVSECATPTTKAPSATLHAEHKVTMKTQQITRSTLINAVQSILRENSVVILAT